ncbi:unnamed protein product, partial [Durusdinium trenchii]
MYWDTQMDDFDESPFGEFLADPVVKTIVPVLFRAHWGALEIERIHNRAHVTICQFPPSLHDAVLRIVARKIDIGFSCLVPHVEFDSPAPHLCGWTLVGKWIKELQILERLPDFRQQVPEPAPNLRNAIDLVIDTTLNNLRDARAQAQLALIAVKLRRDFFYFLLKTIGQGDQVTPHELLSAFPCHYTQPPDKPTPIPLSSLSMSHVIVEKIEARLSHFLLRRGWMATDEFNYLCDYAKRVNPSTLITPAAVWCPARQDLFFPEQPPPNLRPYGHILWPVLFEHHWIQFEIYKASERSMLNLLVTAPHSMQSRLNQIVINILAQLHTTPDQTNITYIVQLTPPNMCGYAVAKDIFDRLEIGIPPVAEQTQQCLIQSQYQGTIHRIQQDDRQVWISSGASEDLLYWDVSSSDFDESPYGEIDVSFDRPTIIPILLQAHWGAIEVLRKESSIDLTLHQIPVHLHQSLVRIVGRRMDVGPGRISFRVGSLQCTPHLCGWQLIYKWASDLNLFDHIPDITGQFNVPSPEIQDLIRMVVSAAMEDWRDAQATPAVALLAAKLRRYFFYAVWTATELGHPASEHTLLSAYPLHYIQPPDAPQPLPLSSATMRHVIADRIQSRLDHMSLHAGWLATDESDHICEVVRIMDPQTLIAPASVYKVHHTQSVHLLLTAPPAMHQSLNHVVNRILEALNVIPATASITYFVETTPPGMCGYALVKNIFDRAVINIPEFSTQQLLRLTLSEHAHRIAVLQREARGVWDRSGASNDLIRFAEFVRSSFLLKVINNDFPPNYFAGGMEDANMSPRQPVVLKDETSKTSYKRLVLLIVIKGKIAYQLPKPTLKFTTVQVSELVLEIDSRFVSKGEFEKYREQPIPAFRKLVGAITDAVSDFIYYGFRLNHHPASGKDDIQLQCIVKIPQASRKPLLEGSLDTSVLPKFWQPSNAELQHMLIEIKNTEGAAGIVITKRGLALRVWSDKIGAARMTLLAGDPRITKENKDVVPKHTFEASGWPIGTTAANVVEATMQSTKVAPIPMRTFRIAGVVTWVLAFASKPTINRFHIEVNGTPHEILLQELTEAFKPRSGGKGSGKTKSSKAPAQPGPKPMFGPQQFTPVPGVSTQDSARIDKLEQRFDRIEARQSRFEEKVDGRFEHISDSLRQILQTVGPSRAREVT